MRTAPTLLLALAVSACAHGYFDAKKWWISLDPTPRAEKTANQVTFLESEPTDRKFKVIGLIATPDDEYDSYAEAVNVARLAAAQNGADAIFLVSTEQGESWGFTAGAGGASGGSKTTTGIRAKAIVWIN